MWPGKESNVGVSRKTVQSGLERLHPHMLFAYLCMAGILLVFTVLLAAFAGAQMYNVKFNSATLPLAFITSTIVLLLSSGTIELACKAQKTERYKPMIAWLACTLCLALTFMAMQFVAWNELQLQGIYLNGSAAGSYLYLLSGLHLLHLLGGVAFICLVMSHGVKAIVDSVAMLVYCTDKYRVLQLRLVSQYWHFMGGIWLLVFAIFYLLVG